jgi:translation initiation factor 2A
MRRHTLSKVCPLDSLLFLTTAVLVQAWDTATGAVVLELGVKSVNKENWPLLHWAQADEAAFHGVTNTVHQYSRASGFKSER